MPQYIKPANITGLDNTHALYSDIYAFLELGQLNKELVANTALTTTAGTVADTDIGAARSFASSADAITETVAQIAEFSVLVVYKPTGTVTGGADGLINYASGYAAGSKWGIKHEGFNNGMFTTYFRGNYGTDRQVAAVNMYNSADVPTYQSGHAAACVFSATAEMKVVMDGTIDDIVNTQTTNALDLALLTDIEFMQELGATASVNVGAIVVFDRVLTDVELQSVTSDPWAMVDYTVSNTDPALDTPISDIIVPSNTSGTIADISGNFSDADSDPLTYSVTPALPSGMTLNTTTGVISGNGSITVTAAANYTFSADDGNGGTPASDVVSITVTAPAFSVDSVSGGDQPGESWVFALSNASGVGMTANIGGVALPSANQDTNSYETTIPNLLTFAGGIYRFSENLTVEIVDGASSATINVPVIPNDGYVQFIVPDPITGVWASAEFAAAIAPQVLSPGDYGWCLEPAGSDAASGYFPEDSVIPFRFMDMSDATPAWGDKGKITVPPSSASLNFGQIPLTIQAGWNKTDLVDPVTTEGSVLEGYSGDAPVTGDDLEWRVTSTLDSGVTFDVLATGEFEVTEATSGDWVTDIVVERRVVQSDGTIGSTANFTADATPPAQSNNPATGQPTITGTAQVGSTLTADTSGIADADGLGTLNIQWLLDGSPINGATNTTYTPVAGDVGSDVSVRVSFTDGEGNAEGPLTSSAVTIQAAPVVDVTPPNVAIQNAPSSVSNTNPLTLTFQFDEEVTGFAANDITVTNGALSNFTVIDADTYRADVTPDGNGNVLVTVLADAAQDAAGNNSVLAQLSIPFVENTPLNSQNKSGYAKAISITMAQTARGSNDEIGYGLRSMFDTSSLDSFGTMNNGAHGDHVFGHRMIGASFSLESVSGGSEVEFAIAFAQNGWLDASSDKIGLMRVEFYDANVKLTDIYEQKATPIIMVDMSGAVETTVATGANPHVKYTSVDVDSVTDPLSLFASNEYLMVVVTDGGVMVRDTNEGYIDLYPKRMNPPKIDPSLIKASPKTGTVFTNRGNDVEVSLEYLREPLDVTEFDRFVLNASGVTIDTNVPAQASAIRPGDVKGTLILDCGAFYSSTGKLPTSLKAYSARYPSGLVLWEPYLSDANFTINVLTF